MEAQIVAVRIQMPAWAMMAVPGARAGQQQSGYAFRLTENRETGTERSWEGVEGLGLRTKHEIELQPLPILLTGIACSA